MFKIGNVRVEGEAVLAPMEGVNCAAFRMVCKQSGAALVYSPMMMADRIVEAPQLALDILGFRADEHPVALQLGGSNSEKLKSATQICEEFFDIIDINMGCPKSNITGGCKAGAFLTKHPEQLKKVIPPIMSATNKPVTAKIRIGWDDKSVNTLGLVKALQDYGVSAIAIHARTAKAKNSDKPRLEEIKKAKDYASVPIIGNGDVLSPGAAKAMVERTGCDAVMVARGAIGNPLIFKQVNYLLDHGKNCPEPSLDEKSKVFLDFVRFYKEQPRQSITEFRQHAIWFTKGFKGATRIRDEIGRAQSFEAVLQIYKQIATTNK